VNGRGGARARRTQAEAAPGHRSSLSLIALLVTLLTGLCVVVLERASVARLAAMVGVRPSSIPPDVVALCLQLLLLPAAAAVAAYGLAALTIHTIRIGLYVGRLRAYLNGWLRTYAPLGQLGVYPGGVRFEPDGAPDSRAIEPLQRLLLSQRAILLLGDAGAGKTATLHAAARSLVRWRGLLALTLGRAPLPVLLPLTALEPGAAESESALLASLREQVRPFATTGLLARLPHMLRRGELLLLCDHLEELNASQRVRVAAALARLAQPPERPNHVVVTCRLATYVEERRSMAPLESFERVVLSGLRDEDARHAIRRSTTPPTTPRPRTSELGTALTGRALAEPITLPAGLAALAAIWSTPAPLPVGRAALFRAYALVLCARAATRHRRHPEPDGLVRLLGLLAARLRADDTHRLALPSGRSLGRTLVAWLDGDALPVPGTPEDVITPEDAEIMCQAALASGILAQDAARRELRFANGLLEATFAGWWLSRHDRPSGPLAPELLRTEWTLPLLLWGGTLAQPGELALRLAQTSGKGLGHDGDGRMRALAVALAVACEGLAAMLAAPADGDGDAATLATAEHCLRDLLDEAQRAIGRPDTADQLARELAAVEHEAGPELATSITRLAGVQALNRLVRAQLVMLLGLLASAPAVGAIVELLETPDPVLRQAVHQAITLAGAAAAAPLQDALRHENALRRQRASEALTLLGDAGSAAALSGLSGPTPAQRAAAARTLGALKALHAQDALIARLADNDAMVRVAAAHALGHLGTTEAVVALERQLSRADAELRAAIAQALGDSRDPDAVPPLMALLGDPSAPVRAAAATALGRLGDERGAVALQERRADPDPLTQFAVVHALRRLGRD
jgi:HEAT repeat protein